MPAYRYPWEYQPDSLLPNSPLMPAPPALDGQLLAEMTPEEMQALQARSPEPLLPEGISDEDLSALTGLGSHGERKSLLEERRARANELNTDLASGHTSILGSVLGGLGGLVNAGVKRSANAEADAGRMALLDSGDATRSAYAKAIRGVGAQQAGNLGVLSGDPQLSAFGRQAMAQAANEDRQGLRGMTLQQAAERLKIMRQKEARIAETGQKKFDVDAWEKKQRLAQGWKGLSLREQEIAAQGDERKLRRDERAQDDETGMRKELQGHPVAREFFNAEIGFNKMQAAAANPSAAGDISLIFGFMKTMDPGSTVREGEFASAQNAAGVPERIRAMANNILNGQRLTPEQRADFLRTAEGQFNSYRTAYEKLAASYKGLAGKTGANPDRVVLPRSPPDTDLTKPPGTTPAVSTEDQEALKWLRANPNDPDAPAIRDILSKKGLRP